MLRSAPPEKVSLPEVRMTPVTASSVAMRVTIASSSSITATSKTFIERPGMSQVTVRMPSGSWSVRKFASLIG